MQAGEDSREYGKRTDEGDMGEDGGRERGVGMRRGGEGKKGRGEVERGEDRRGGGREGKGVKGKDSKSVRTKPTTETSHYSTLLHTNMFLYANLQ